MAIGGRRIEAERTERSEPQQKEEAELDRENIAQVAHAVNKAYCEALGDMSQAPWEEAPEWQKHSARLGVALHINGEHGPEKSHECWMAQKESEGWRYGPLKNAEIKTHPCMVPFSQLPTDQKAKDFIFRAVVHALKGHIE